MALTRISKRDKLVTVGGKTYLQEKPRRHGRHKLPKKTRDRMRKSRNKIRIPVVNAGVHGMWIGDTLQLIKDGTSGGTNAMLKQGGRGLMRNFTGFDPFTKKWSWRNMTGIAAVGTNVFLGRSGINRIINGMLARAKVPVLRF